MIFRARLLYHNSEDRPEPPFGDQWEDALELQKEWLDVMTGTYG